VSVRDLAVDVLLGLGVFCQAVCCVGLVVARTAFDRLHFSGASTTLGPVCIGAAVLIRESVSAAGIETIVTVALMFLLNPVLTIATARAALRIEQGTLREPPPGTRRPR